jgi:hypothetical protein
LVNAIWNAPNAYNRASSDEEQEELGKQDHMTRVSSGAHRKDDVEEEESHETGGHDPRDGDLEADEIEEVECEQEDIEEDL